MNINPVCTEPSAESHDPADIERNSFRANSTAETSPMLNDIGRVLELVSNEYVFWFK